MVACEPRIEVIICTFRRPHVLRTLGSLAAQALPSDVSIGVIVADNDDRPSAREAVEGLAQGFPHPLTYVHAPARNISVARNAGLAIVRAPWVAFLDDDEIAPPGWIGALWRAAGETGADAVFGPVLAEYPPDAPAWIVGLDAHSTWPARRGGIIETGYAGNVLMRWGGTAWADLRFELARGRTGGEDTAFFFAAHRLGARFAEASDAAVREPVTPERLSFRWLARRRFRMGQSYSLSSSTAIGRATLLLSAVGKGVACGAVALSVLPWRTRRNFWALRGALHAGVAAGCLTLPQAQLYGD